MRAVHRATGIPVFIKAIDKNRVKTRYSQRMCDRFLRVINDDQLNHHPHFCARYELLHDEDHVYIVNEMAFGSDLDNYVKNRIK